MQALTTDLQEAIKEAYGKKPKAGNAFLEEKQAEAFAAFESIGLPAPKNEEYKYTPIARHFGKKFSFELPTEIKEKVSLPENILSKDTYQLVFVNGVYQEKLSHLPQKDVNVMSLSKAAEDKVFQRYFQQYTPIKSDGFVALNAAFSNGLFIHVAPKAVVDKPIALIYLMDNETEAGMVAQQRVFTVVGERAEVTIEEHFKSMGQLPTFTNALSEIIVSRDANVRYYKIQEECNEAYHVGTTQVDQIEKSVFSAVSMSLSGAMVRNNLNISMHAEHSECHMHGLYMLDGKTHVDNHTTVDHKVAHCESNELYKGIVDGSATAVFNGKIYVRQDAQKTNAFQSNRNVVLSDSAKVDTKPQLEIWADDVSCSHGCTVGQLDAEQLFYLRARGLSKAAAKAMLLTAFAKDVLENIKDEHLTAQLEDTIVHRLETNA